MDQPGTSGEGIELSGVRVEVPQRNDTSGKQIEEGMGVTNSTYDSNCGNTNDGFTEDSGDENVPSEMTSKIILAWEDIECTVPTICMRQKNHTDLDKPNTLLQGITGIVESGNILALMGPSGSGKTTLLDTLADRVGSLKVKGKIFLNGVERKPETFRNLSCYVNCEDSFYEILSIQETMMFTASLAIKERSTREDAVKQALEEVGLYSYRNNRIGGSMFRGLSTGQKRRLSICVELLKNPWILFLDEPLSGLDNYGANKVMESLRSLAQKNKIIILSVHQPPDRVWRMFDSLTVLSKGMMLFSGRRENALPWFQKFFVERDRQPSDCTNEGDYILDCINLDFEEGETANERRNDLEALKREWGSSNEHCETAERIKTAQYESSPLMDSKSFKAGFFSQSFHLTNRALRNNVYHPGFYWAKFLIYILLDVLIGSLYFQSRDIAANYIASMIYFVQSYLVVLTTAALPCLILIRPVFLKERSNGLIDVLPYTIATFIAMAPWVLGAAVSSATILHFMVNLSNFPWLVGILTATILCAESTVNLIASLTDQLIVGLAIATGIFGAFMINAGFILPYYLIPNSSYTAFRAVYHISFHKYSLRSLLHNEFKAPKYYVLPKVPIHCPNTPNVSDVSNVNTNGLNYTAPLSALGQKFSESAEGLANNTEKLFSPVLELYRVGDVTLENDLAVLLAYTLVIQILLFLVTYKQHTGRR